MKILLVIIGIAILWNHPEARTNTAKFLRLTANFLSPVNQPIEQRDRER